MVYGIDGTTKEKVEVMGGTFSEKEEIEIGSYFNSKGVKVGTVYRRVFFFNIIKNNNRVILSEDIDATKILNCYGIYYTDMQPRKCINDSSVYFTCENGYIPSTGDYYTYPIIVNSSDEDATVTAVLEYYK